MESEHELKQRIHEVLGPHAFLYEGTSGDRKVYVLCIEQQPLDSDSATRVEAWKRVQDALEIGLTSAPLFEPNCHLEVIVGFAESVRKTKRRIFRVGGPLAEIGTLKTPAPVTTSGDVYVVAYDNWQSPNVQ